MYATTSAAAVKSLYTNAAEIIDRTIDVAPLDAAEAAGFHLSDALGTDTAYAVLYNCDTVRCDILFCMEHGIPFVVLSADEPTELTGSGKWVRCGRDGWKGFAYRWLVCAPNGVKLSTSYDVLAAVKCPFEVRSRLKAEEAVELWEDGVCEFDDATQSTEYGYVAVRFPKDTPIGKLPLQWLDFMVAESWLRPYIEHNTYAACKAMTDRDVIELGGHTDRKLEAKTYSLLLQSIRTVLRTKKPLPETSGVNALANQKATSKRPVTDSDIIRLCYGPKQLKKMALYGDFGNALKKLHSHPVTQQLLTELYGDSFSFNSFGVEAFVIDDMAKLHEQEARERRFSAHGTPTWITPPSSPDTDPLPKNVVSVAGGDKATMKWMASTDRTLTLPEDLDFDGKPTPAELPLSGHRSPEAAVAAAWRRSLKIIDRLKRAEIVPATPEDTLRYQQEGIESIDDVSLAARDLFVEMSKCKDAEYAEWQSVNGRPTRLLKSVRVEMTVARHEVTVAGKSRRKELALDKCSERGLYLLEALADPDVCSLLKRIPSKLRRILYLRHKMHRSWKSIRAIVKCKRSSKMLCNKTLAWLMSALELQSKRRKKLARS